jgi:hypothetical protein
MKKFELFDQCLKHKHRDSEYVRFTVEFNTIPDMVIVRRYKNDGTQGQLTSWSEADIDRAIEAFNALIV